VERLDVRAMEMIIFDRFTRNIFNFPKVPHFVQDEHRVNTWGGRA